MPRNALTPSCRAAIWAAPIALMAGASPGFAQSDPVAARMDAMQRQIQALQKELQDLRRQSARQEARTEQVAARQQQANRQAGPVRKGDLPIIVKATLACAPGSYALGDKVCFTPGGFIELAAVIRSPNEVADVNSDFGGIPFGNSLLARQTEQRFTARQSRLSGLFTATIEPNYQASAYYEFDFLAAGVTSNSRESNSYVPRIRHVFAAFDDKDTGFGFLGGQTWSLLTTNTSGLDPLKAQLPLTIDAQYVPGFNWTRNPQVRFTQRITPELWAGVSLESPQSILPPAPFGAPATINVNNAGNGAGLNNSTTTYSNNYAPDIAGKLAWEPGFGHYELKGVARFFTVRTLRGQDDAVGFGIGGAATFPLIPKVLDLQLSGLAGDGIGRYGSSQLPDFALNTNGTIATIPSYQVLGGLIWHAQPGTDIYAYGGLEQTRRAGAVAFTGGATTGFGSPLANNSGCSLEGSALCQAQTERVWQVTGGFWHDIYKGDFGRVAVGAQGSYTQRQAFPGLNGIAPQGDLVVGLASLRYYPF
ncbi:MAG: hypothetical protein JO048_12435 [Methylobacteriaceae bacterium]|nr:hypothetical protein [Methylobacteriaceae bacterium]